MLRPSARSTLQRVCPQCGSRATGLMCPIDGFATVLSEGGESRTLEPGTTLLGRFVIESFSEQDGAVANYRARMGETLVRIAVVAVPERWPKPGAAMSRGAQDDEGQRMLREAQALTRLQHANVALVLATGLTDDGDLAIVSEHVAGQSLEELMRNGPLESERTMEIGLGLLTALEAAHEQRLTHHDLAPARVLLTADGRVVLTDTGYADLLRAPDALVDESPTLSRGAPYRAPEQARARSVTRHADIYSVGAILFEMLTGKLHSSVAAAQPATRPTRTPEAVSPGSPAQSVFDKAVAAPGHGQPFGPSAEGHGQPFGPSAEGHGQPFGPSAEGHGQPFGPSAEKGSSEPGSAPMAMPSADGSGLYLLKTDAIEPPLAEFVARCLEKKPWNRYDTAALAREALEAVREAVELSGPIGQARLGELAWDAPQPQLATRETVRPDPGMSGLLNIGTRPANEQEASRPTAVIPDIDPIAPIARPMVQYVRPRRQGWWLAAAAVALVAVGVGSALLFMPALDETPHEVAAVGIEQAPAAAAVKEETIAAHAAQARLEAEAAARAAVAARIEAEAAAKAAVAARTEADTRAKAAAEAPMVLEAVGPEDDDAKMIAAKVEADAAAKVEAQAKATLEAETKAKLEAQAKATLEAETKARLEAETKAKLEAEAKGQFEVGAQAQREAEAKRGAEAKAKLEADAKAVQTQPPVTPLATAPTKKTWAEIRAAEVAAAQEQARLRLEAATKARLERERKEAEAARAAAAAREARDAAWKKKVEVVEREQKLLEEQRKADVAARREARLAAEAEKAAAAKEAAEAAKLAKQARIAKSETPPSEPAAPVDPSLYRALLSTVPAGASVLVDGALVGKTPLTVNWKPGAVKHVWVMLEGHLPTSLDLGDAQNSKMLRIELVASAPDEPQPEAPGEDQ